MAPASVRQATEEVERHEFELLLCDLNIQREGGGYEALRAMRKVNPHCIVIVLTGYPGFQSAVEGIHLGINDNILKPMKPDTLVARLAEKLIARQSTSPHCGNVVWRGTSADTAHLPGRHGGPGVRQM